MRKTIKERMRNYYFWVSVSAFLLLLANTLGLHVVEEDWNNLVNGFLGLLVMLGVLTTDPKNTKDDKQEPPTDS